MMDEISLAALFAATACASTACDRELGYEVNNGELRQRHDEQHRRPDGRDQLHAGARPALRPEVPDTVNFAFNSSQLDQTRHGDPATAGELDPPVPRSALPRLRPHRPCRSAAYNYAPRQAPRRSCRAPILSTQGISRSRLEALVSFGKTRPLIQTTAPELRNRRTVTEVSGFVQNASAGPERQICRGHLPRVCRQSASPRAPAERRSIQTAGRTPARQLIASHVSATTGRPVPGQFVSKYQTITGIFSPILATIPQHLAPNGSSARAHELRAGLTGDSGTPLIGR